MLVLTIIANYLVPALPASPDVWNGHISRGWQWQTGLFGCGSGRFYRIKHSQNDLVMRMQPLNPCPKCCTPWGRQVWTFEPV